MQLVQEKRQFFFIAQAPVLQDILALLHPVHDGRGTFLALASSAGPGRTEHGDVAGQEEAARAVAALDGAEEGSALSGVSAEAALAQEAPVRPDLALSARLALEGGRVPRSGVVGKRMLLLSSNVFIRLNS